MKKKLYIIGNGFDRHHGIPSDYKDFGRYLEQTDPETYQTIERYFLVDDQFWWQFEEMLAFIDTDTLIDDASQFLMCYAAENWSDSYHHDYQYELNRAVQAISSTMRARFADWIRKLPIPAPQQIAPENFVSLDPAAQFLNFNYTPTLQQTYGIPNSQVFHIHGDSRQPDSNIVLGHGWERGADDSLNHGLDHEDADTRVIEGNQIIDEYFSATFKPFANIISTHHAFFDSLKSVQEILVMGHSLAEVDAPYFHEIIKNIDPTTAKWTVSYHRDSEEAEPRMHALGIDQNLIEYKRLPEF